MPARERAAVEREAASANVNVLVSVAPPSQFLVEPRASCKAPFVELEAYCEKTLVSGVGIAPGTKEPDCTAGPMLVEGSETYMLTSGHCFGEVEVNGVAIKVTTTSAYPGVAGQKEIGKEGTQYYGTTRDMAEVKIKRPGSEFIEALPKPLPALMAEWGKAPATPHTVGGVAAVIEKQENVCHEGMVSGEACGNVGVLNVTVGTKKHLVEVTACGSKGDSGGPYFFRGKGEEVVLLGIETLGPKPECREPGPYLSYFEPLEGLAGAANLGSSRRSTGRASSQPETKPGRPAYPTSRSPYPAAPIRYTSTTKT